MRAVGTETEAGPVPPGAASHLAGLLRQHLLAAVQLHGDDTALSNSLHAIRDLRECGDLPVGATVMSPNRGPFLRRLDEDATVSSSRK